MKLPIITHSGGLFSVFCDWMTCQLWDVISLEWLLRLRCCKNWHVQNCPDYKPVWYGRPEVKCSMWNFTLKMAVHLVNLGSEVNWTSVVSTPGRSWASMMCDTCTPTKSTMLDPFLTFPESWDHSLIGAVLLSLPKWPNSEEMEATYKLLGYLLSLKGGTQYLRDPCYGIWGTGWPNLNILGWKLGVKFYFKSGWSLDELRL